MLINVKFCQHTDALLFQTSTSVSTIHTIVMRMLSALTTLAAFHVHATLDILAMEHFAVSELKLTSHLLNNNIITYSVLYSL